MSSKEERRVTCLVTFVEFQENNIKMIEVLSHNLVFSYTFLPVGLGFLASPVLLSGLSFLLAVEVNTALTTLIWNKNIINEILINSQSVLIKKKKEKEDM